MASLASPAITHSWPSRSRWLWVTNWETGSSSTNSTRKGWSGTFWLSLVSALEGGPGLGLSRGGKGGGGGGGGEENRAAGTGGRALTTSRDTGGGASWWEAVAPGGGCGASAGCDEASGGE